MNVSRVGINTYGINKFSINQQNNSITTDSVVFSGIHSPKTLPHIKSKATLPILVTLLTVFSGGAALKAQEIPQPQPLIQNSDSIGDAENSERSVFQKTLIKDFPRLKDDLDANNKFWASLTPSQRDTALKIESIEAALLLSYGYTLDSAKAGEIAVSLGAPQDVGLIKTLAEKFQDSISKYSLQNDMFASVLPLYSTLSPERQEIYESVYGQVVSVTHANTTKKVYDYVEVSPDNVAIIMANDKNYNKQDVPFYIRATGLSNAIILNDYEQKIPDIDNYKANPIMMQLSANYALTTI